MSASSATPRDQKPIILDFSRSELEREVVDVLGQSKFRAKQIWQALHRECIPDFESVTTLPKGLREELARRYTSNPLERVMHLTSADGSTDKALFRLSDGELVETVLMRYAADSHRKARKTVCVSTQAGCALGCTFCATGQQGFRRQLTTGEIVAQIIFMQRIALAEDRSEVENGAREMGSVQGVTNVVFMGMGEPLANYENTMSAIRSINDANGLAVGGRHITLSTVGLAPQIVRLARENIQINLAVSLHAPDDATRSQTMPINRRYPISVLLDACRRYVEMTDRRIFFEYVLLQDQNDRIRHARRLGELLSGMLCHVNLIPVNPTADGPYRRTSRADAERFQLELRRYRVPSTVRIEKGIDIDAGCGQLRARVIDTGALRKELTQASRS